MHLFRRGAALALALALLVLPAATAAEASTVERATALYSLGLFQGVSDSFDEESMALDSPTNRIQGLVMFLRLLGVEDKAIAGDKTHPFSDVDPWAEPYAGYAHTAGLVNGVGGGRFGSLSPVRLNDYVTMLLRALRYDEAAGDFTWAGAGKTGLELGLYDEDFAGRTAEGMTRGDLVDLSYAALSLPLKNSTVTLAGILVQQGAVAAEGFMALGIPLEVEAPKPEPSPEVTPTPTPTPSPSPEATPTPPAVDGVDTATMESIQAVVKLVNEARSQQGLKDLVLDTELTKAAMIRAEEIGRSFSHTRPDGRSWSSVLSDNGISYRASGENIAYGYGSAQAVMTGWLNSSGHRANILGENFGRIGVGLVNDRWVQLFTN